MEDQEILNRLWIKGDENEVSKVKESIKGTDEADSSQEIHIDFNKIIKMPTELDIKHDKHVFIAILNTIDPEQPIDVDGPHPLNLNSKDFTLYVKYLENLRNYGHSNWLHWRIKNWNSAWNAYNTTTNKDYINFSTSKHPPLNVIFQLSIQHKDIIFEIGYLERDTDSLGIIKFHNGIASQISFESQEEKSAFANNILGGN